MTKRFWLSAASAGAAVLMLLTGAGCGTGAGGGASSTAATTEKNAAESTSVGSKETGGELAATDGTLASQASGEKTTIKETTKRNSTKTTAKGSTQGQSLEDMLKSIPSKLKNTTIKFFVWNDVMSMPEGDIIKEFMQKTGIKVDVEQGAYEEFYTMLNAKVLSGKSPDVIRLLSNGINCVKSLQPLEHCNYTFDTAIWSEQTMKDYTFNGKAYAANLKNTVFLDGAVALYNKSIFEENDLDDPYALWKKGKWDWAAFEKLAKEFCKLGSGDVGASEFGFAASVGANMVEYDGKKYVNTMESAAYRQAMAKYLEYIKSGFFSSTPYDITAFMDGKCGFFFESINGAHNKHNRYQKFRLKKQLAVVPYPTNGAKDYLPLIQNSAWGVPKGAANAEAVPYFLRYMLDYDNYKEGLFMNNESKEIYESMLTNPNRIQAEMAGNLVNDDCGMNYLDMMYRIRQTEPSQIATTLATYKANVDDAVKKANEQIQAMSK